jgi:sensor domain CHASE-containing protein
MRRLRIVLAVLFLLLALGTIGAGMLWLQHERSARAMNACVNHLGNIEAAKQQWSTDQPTNAVPFWDDLAPYLERANAPLTLKCPAGGSYTVGTLTEPARCSLGGPLHSLR